MGSMYGPQRMIRRGDVAVLYITILDLQIETRVRVVNINQTFGERRRENAMGYYIDALGLTPFLILNVSPTWQVRRMNSHQGQSHEIQGRFS